jgi:hypothetical protein
MVWEILRQHSGDEQACKYAQPPAKLRALERLIDISVNSHIKHFSGKLNRRTTPDSERLKAKLNLWRAHKQIP